jgi:hypothetical protein
MPTEREAVLNKSLSGLELKALILRDFSKMLDEEGMLTQYSAYGRCAYDIRLRIHTDNVMNRISESTQHSRAQARQHIEVNPGLAAVEQGVPLRDPSPDSEVGATELIRNVSSPNSERLNAGLPITVDTREQDGSKVQKSVTYPAPEPGEVPESVGMTDLTAQTRKDWDLKPVQAPPPVAADSTRPIDPTGPQPITPGKPVPGTAPVAGAKPQSRPAGPQPLTPVPAVPGSGPSAQSDGSAPPVSKDAVGTTGKDA